LSEMQSAKKAMDEKLGALEKEKSILEANIKRLNLDNEHAEHERADMEEKLVVIKKSLDKEIQGNVELAAIGQETKARLERQFATTCEELETAKGVISEYGEKAEGGVLTIAASQKEAEDARGEARSAQLALDEAGTSITQLERKLVRESEKVEAAEKSIGVYEKREVELKKKLEVYDESSNVLSQGLEESATTIKKMARDFIVLEESHTEISQKYQQLLENSSPVSPNPEDLEFDSKLDKQKNHYESEIGGISQSLSDEKTSNKELKVKISAMSVGFEELTRKFEAITERHGSLGKDNEQSIADMEAMQQNLREAREKLNTLGQKASLLEKENSGLQKDSQELLERFMKESSVSADAKKRVNELEQLLDNESKLKLHAESSLRSLDAERQELQAEIGRLQVRISTMKDIQGSSIQDQHDLDERLKALELRERTLNEENVAANATIARLMASEAVLKKTQLSDAITIKLKRKDLSVAEAINQNLSVQIEGLSARVLEDDTIIARKADRIHELEEGMSSPLSKSSTIKRAVSIISSNVSLDGRRSIEPEHKRIGSTGSLFKSDDKKSIRSSSGLLGLKLGNLGSMSIGRSRKDKKGETLKSQTIGPKHSEDEYDDTNSVVSSSTTSPYDFMSFTDRDRKGSTISSVSSNTQRIRHAENAGMVSRCIYDLVYDFSDGLKGWLKIPKGGRIKKGWKKVFAVVLDYKIYLYEKEKDADDASVDALGVFDLKYVLK
jgi:chromosome segregation ATPase